nr:hypothetical protein [Paraflavitalea speifideiaquila]
MLDCLAPKFAEHHALVIEKEAIRECVRLAKDTSKIEDSPIQPLTCSTGLWLLLS